MVQGGERSVRKTSHFSLTCRLLSQYLKKKKKKNGNRGELALRQQAKENSLVPNTVSFEPGVDVSGKNHHRHAENSILTKEESNMATNTKEKRKDQFTVFYGGKVVVFDNIPADRAKDLMLMASKDTTCNLMTLQPQANNSSGDCHRLHALGHGMLSPWIMLIHLSLVDDRYAHSEKELPPSIPGEEEGSDGQGTIPSPWRLGGGEDGGRPAVAQLGSTSSGGRKHLSCVALRCFRFLNEYIIYV
nr:PREDICTED: protein TIFY 10a-like isoform X1 [Musa acuminata subsp. malaccensis]